MPNIKATEDVSEILKSILKGDYTALKVIEIREIEINNEKQYDTISTISTPKTKSENKNSQQTNNVRDHNPKPNIHFSSPLPFL